jgi:hypothetical protein
MVAIMRDTNGAALDRYHELLRAQAPHERLAKAAALSRMTRELAVAGIRSRFPSASDDEVQVRLAVRLYGRTTAQRLFVEVPQDAR